MAMSDYQTAVLKLEITVVKEKNVRGKITGHTAELGSLGGHRIGCWGKTKGDAISALQERIGVILTGLGKAEIVSEPHVNFHAMTISSGCGGYGYRTLNVTNGKVTLGSMCSGGAGDTYAFACGKMREHAHSATHGRCGLCGGEKPWEDLVYYSAVVRTSVGPSGDCPMLACAVCETSLGVDSTLATLRLKIPHQPQLWRVGPIAPDGAYPKIPASVLASVAV